MALGERCPVLKFEDLGDERGKLVVIEGGQSVPFEINRVFYIYKSDKTVVRGGARKQGIGVCPDQCCRGK